MIAPQELRIGNLVSYTEKGILKYAKVITIENEFPGEDYYCVYISDNQYVTLDLVSPIPLSEEWLKKLGFVKYGNIYKNKYAAIRKYEDGYRLVIESQLEGNFVMYFTGIDPIEIPTLLQYVHTLQNLYFALTGKELTINDTLPG